MPILCSECSTENRSDATVCTHCAKQLPAPASTPAPQRRSILERTMAPTQSEPVAAVATQAAPAPAPVPAPAATPAVAAKVEPKPQPIPTAAQPIRRSPRKRSRTPWMLAAVLLIALLASVAFEKIQQAQPAAPAVPSTSP
ncbi:hypothetical protein [Rhodoferax sp.]|uniref:hypothetical protein n=1 Tax=Rhodoferax sp. TaxID=50421 RepID=UPI00374CBF5B